MKYNKQTQQQQQQTATKNNNNKSKSNLKSKNQSTKFISINLQKGDKPLQYTIYIYISQISDQQIYI